MGSAGEPSGEEAAVKLLVGTRKGLWSLASEDRAEWSASEPAFFGQIVQHATRQHGLAQPAVLE